MSTLEIYIIGGIGLLLFIGLVIDAQVRSRNKALSLSATCQKQHAEIQRLSIENRKLRARLDSKKQLTGCVWQERCEKLELEIERKDRAYKLLHDEVAKTFDKAKSNAILRKADKEAVKED